MSTAEPTAENLEEARAFIARRFGHQCAPERSDGLRRALQQAAQACGFEDPSQYLQELLAEAGGDRLSGKIFAELSVGETYFFRDPDVFAAIQNVLLPELEARNPGRLLRVWSAGCATGEEAYSLAILLSRARSRHPALRFEVRASDLNGAFLERARAGVFREWSFRAAPPWLKPAYFEAGPNGTWTLRRTQDVAVDFFPLNLAEGSFPSAANGTADLDLIFCRNVLLYFTPEQFARTVRQLARCLRPGGWLVLSPVEVTHTSEPLLRPLRSGGTTVFVRSGEGAGGAAPPERVQGYTAEESVRSILAAASAGRPPEGLGEEARAAAANRVAPQAQDDRPLPRPAPEPAAGKLDPARYHAAAMAQQEAGAWQEAEHSLRCALYLDPAFVAARVSLGVLLMKRRRPAEACRCFRHAIDQLQRLAPDAQVPGIDIPRGILAPMLQTLLENAGRSTDADLGGAA